MNKEIARVIIPDYAEGDTIGAELEESHIPVWIIGKRSRARGVTPEQIAEEHGISVEEVNVAIEFFKAHEAAFLEFFKRKSEE